MMTREEIRRSPLFEGISYDSYLQMVDCFQMRTKAYQPGEIILNFGEGNPHQVGILEDGTAALLRIDADGNNTILEEMGAGSVFGETVAFSGIGGGRPMGGCGEGERGGGWGY